MIRLRNQIVSQQEKICSGLFSQMIGLMFQKRKNLVMVFDSERKISLHNYFVFYPIEVLVLNSEKKVLEIKKEFRPFTLWNSLVSGKYLIELGLEESKNKVKLGDLLEF